MTFTNLSAREMKHRVDQRIQQASIEDPNNEHLKNQRIKNTSSSDFHFTQFLFEINSTTL